MKCEKRFCAVQHKAEGWQVNTRQGKATEICTKEFVIKNSTFNTNYYSMFSNQTNYLDRLKDRELSKNLADELMYANNVRPSCNFIYLFVFCYYFF